MWKPEYAENRKKKYAASEEERDKRKQQSRSPEENAVYMREYHSKNKEKIKEYRKRTADKRNARRRELYKTDPERRARQIKQSKEWRQQNPDKHFAQRLKKYNITPDEYYAMREEQNGGCAICGRKQKRFHVDHCHKTEKVRGLLCSECNLGVGKFSDNPEHLESAAMYLQKHASLRLAFDGCAHRVTSG